MYYKKWATKMWPTWKWASMAGAPPAAHGNPFLYQIIWEADLISLEEEKSLPTKYVGAHFAGKLFCSLSDHRRSSKASAVIPARAKQNQLSVNW